MATDVAADILSGTVCLDKKGNARLEGGFEMPTRKNMSGQHGVLASDGQKIGSSLIDAVLKILYKCKEAGESVPTSYEELLRELEQADKPYIGPANGQKPARPILMGPITQEDLNIVTHRQAGDRGAHGPSGRPRAALRAHQGQRGAPA